MGKTINKKMNMKKITELPNRVAGINLQVLAMGLIVVFPSGFLVWLLWFPQVNIFYIWFLGVSGVFGIALIEGDDL